MAPDPNHLPDPWVWWYRLVLFWVLACNLIIGVTLCSGENRLFDTPSLNEIRAYTWPWQAWGALWLVAAALLIWRRIRIGGYFLGAVMAGFFTLWGLGYSTVEGHIGNVIVSVLASQAALINLAGIRYQLIILSRPGVAASIASANETT